MKMLPAKKRISKLLLRAYEDMAQHVLVGEKSELLPWGQLSCYLLTLLTDIPLAKQYLLNVVCKIHTREMVEK